MNETTNSMRVDEVPAPVTHELHISDFQKLTMKELIAVYDALRTLEGVTCGLLNQPKFRSGQSRAINAAGDIIDDLNTHVSCLISTIVDAAKSATPKGEMEVEAKAWILLKNEADSCDDVAGLLVLAAAQSKAVYDAVVNEALALGKGA